MPTGSGTVIQGLLPVVRITPDAADCRCFAAGGFRRGKGNVFYFATGQIGKYPGFHILSADAVSVCPSNVRALSKTGPQPLKQYPMLWQNNIFSAMQQSGKIIRHQRVVPTAAEKQKIFRHHNVFRNV